MQTKASNSTSFAAIRTIGFLLTPAALTLALLDHDRELNQVRPETQMAVDRNQFWNQAQTLAVPGLELSRVPQALDYLQSTFPANELCQLPGFSGEITSLFWTENGKYDLKALMPYQNTLFYMAPEWPTDWFEPAYNSPDELLQEFKANFGRRWPKKGPFNWKAHVVELYGIYQA